MRLLFTGLTAVAAASALAVTLNVPPLPEPAFADREVSGDAALPADRSDKLNVFRLEMTFNATPSNNVQVAVGRDAAPSDNALATEETDIIIGWDCGEWFLRPRGLRERYTFMPQDSLTSCRRTLQAEIRVGRQGVPLAVSFSEKGAGSFAFQGLALPPFPVWLTPGPWTHLRVTTRGSDTANEVVSAQFVQEYATMIRIW